ncbi:MAG: stage 0 sporulation protein [Clostridia bacterium]|nr:stage 0 sporulation protein [Clostridia bacterium]
MQKIEVRFRYNPKLFSFVSSDILKQGDFIVVESALGQSFGMVQSVSNALTKDESMQKILRKASESDILQNENIKEKEKIALLETRKLVEKLKLDMNVVNAEYSFDGSKVLIDFISENRVDFRELVRDLASILHTRIELKQIGVRDQAKMVGGIGICGRVCCCAAHLKDFEKVSIKMAKSQDLALNPVKISGACGRLMCCLAYEDPVYNELQSTTPRIGSQVKTAEGVGTVVYRKLLSQVLSVKFESADGSVHFKDFDVKDVTFVQRSGGDDRKFKNNKKNDDKKDEN